MPPNPNTSTRAEFTASYLAIQPLPEDPSISPKWTRLVNSLLALIKALGEHEAMQRNNKQTYMTPAKDKNAQYFAWDFVGRTIVGGVFLSFLELLVCYLIIHWCDRCDGPEKRNAALALLFVLRCHDLMDIM
jgi:hypothetical protein